MHRFEDKDLWHYAKCQMWQFEFRTRGLCNASPRKYNPQLKGSKDNMWGKTGAMQLHIKAYHFDSNILIGWQIPLWLQAHLFHPWVLQRSSRSDTGLKGLDWITSRKRCSDHSVFTRWSLLLHLMPKGMGNASGIYAVPVWHQKNRSILSRKTRRPTQ